MTNMVIFLSQKCQLILFIKMNVMVSTSCWVTSQSTEQLGTVYRASVVWRGRAGFTRVKRAGKKKGWIREELLVWGRTAESWQTWLYTQVGIAESSAEKGHCHYQIQGCEMTGVAGIAAGSAAATLAVAEKPWEPPEQQSQLEGCTVFSHGYRQRTKYSDS